VGSECIKSSRPYDRGNPDLHLCGVAQLDIDVCAASQDNPHKSPDEKVLQKPTAD